MSVSYVTNQTCMWTGTGYYPSCAVGNNCGEYLVYFAPSTTGVTLREVVDEFVQRATEAAARAKALHSIVKPPVARRVPDRVGALNTGQQLRRMRASIGLARGRT